MNVLVPDKSKKSLSPANKTFLADSLSAKMRETIITDDGRQLTVAQAMTERLANIAMFAESNTDAIAAQKLIYERLYGKAAVQKDEDVKPMPKVIFSLNDDGIQKVENSVNQKLEIENPDNEALVEINIDGKEYVG